MAAVNNLTNLDQLGLALHTDLMTTVNIYEAKTRLSALIAEAEAGGEVVIAKAGRPVVRLVPVDQPLSPRTPGAMKGKIELAEDFDAFDAEIERWFSSEDEQ